MNAHSLLSLFRLRKVSENVAVDLNWLLLIPCAALAATAVPAPLVLGRASVPDVLVCVGLLSLVVGLALSRTGVRYPVVALLFLFLYGVSAAANPMSSGGLAEVVQRTLQFLAGLAAFSWLAHRRPNWAVTSVSAALFLSTCAALLQGASGVPFGELDGLFSSRLSFCTFQIVALLWCFPQWLHSSVSIPLRVLTVVSATLVLLPVSHGQVFAVGAVVLVVCSCLRSRMALSASFAAVVLSLFVLATFPGGGERLGELGRTLSASEGDGRIKQAHVETVAAFRMAVAHPWLGVGPGNYQDNIGAHYGELPNPNAQTIEADHQAGWAILAATAGLPTALLLLALLAGGAIKGFRRFRTPRSAEERLLVGGGTAAVALLLLGFVTDPLVRGTGWLLALALASTTGWQGGWLIRQLKARAFILLAALAMAPAALAVAIYAFGGDGGGANDGVVTFSWQEGATSGADASLADDPSVAALLAVDKAMDVTAPMRRSEVDGLSALLIPEGAGKPPAERESRLEDGGARFPIPENLEQGTAHVVWLHVFWHDGCGNSLEVRAGDAPPVVAGNDGTYARWHWVRVPGTVRPGALSDLLILNREDGVALSHILFSSSKQYVPTVAP